MASFMFSDTDDSENTQSLHGRIGLISRQLTNDISSSLDQTGSFTPEICHNMNCNALHYPFLANEGHENNMRTIPESPFSSQACYEWSSSYLNHNFSNSPFVARHRTPVLLPPSRFRDYNHTFFGQQEPDIPSTDTALDLRIKPLALNVVDQPSSQPILPNSSHSHGSAPVRHDGERTATDATGDQYFTSCSFLNHSFSCPYESVRNSDQGNDIERFETETNGNIPNILAPHMDETNSTTVDQTSDLLGSHTRTKSTPDSGLLKTTKNPSSSKLDTNLDFTTDIQINTACSSPNLNHTYAVSRPLNWDRNPQRGQTRQVNSCANDDNIQGAEKDSKITDSSACTTLSDNSSFTSVTSLGSDVTNSEWSVKSAVTSFTSSLTLTLTKSPTSTPSPHTSNTPPSRRETPTPQLGIERVVTGSNNANEGARLMASSTKLSTDGSSFLSFPATPDVFGGTTMNIDSETGLESKHGNLCSTPRPIRQQPIGEELVTTPKSKSKQESLRTTLLKKSVSKRQDIDNESVLNIAFRQEHAKPSPSKRKKKSLIKTLKKQLMCNNAGNVSTFSQNDQTVTAACLGRIANQRTNNKSSKGTTTKKKSCSPILPLCTKTANESCATISFITLNRSSMSTPMSAWCRQIMSTTQSQFTTQPLSTPVEDSSFVPRELSRSSKSTSKSVGISTSTPPCSTTAQQEVPHKHQRHIKSSLTDCSAFSLLSDIHSYHTPTKDSSTSSKLFSTSSQQSIDQQQTISQKCQGSTANLTEPGVDASCLQDSHDNSSVSYKEIKDNHARHWLSLSPHNSHIDMVSKVGRLTAEWLVTFVHDKDMKTFQSRFDVQPNRNILMELCYMCNIKVTISKSDPEVLTLKKSRSSRAPKESDLQRLIRGIRR